MRLKNYHRIFIFLLGVLFLTCLLSPWAAWGLDLIRTWRPEWQGLDYPFSRIFNRVFMIMGILLFFPCFRFLKIRSVEDLGLTHLRRDYGYIFIGAGLAVGSFAILVALMTAVEVFQPEWRVTLAAGLLNAFKAMMTGLTVGLIEEVFFRGMIFNRLRDEWSPVGAYAVANALYSAAHFIKPAQKSYVQDFDPWLGFVHLARTFEPFTDPVTLLPGFFGLFLLGIVLSYAFARTGSLYLSIGLHMGWVLAIKSINSYGGYSGADLGWIFGSANPRFVSGVATWIGFLTVLILVHYLTRNRPTPSSGRPPQAAA